MNKHLLRAGIGVTSIALLGWLGVHYLLADEPLDGAWTLQTTVESDDSSWQPEPGVTVTYTFNTVAHTLLRSEQVAGTTVSRTLPFTTLENGNLHFDVDSRTVEISAVIDGSTLTLTTVSSTGASTPPTPQPYREGTAPPPDLPERACPKSMTLIR